MNIKALRRHFDDITNINGYKKVERSNIISPFFQNEFNISGAHQYLMPIILDNEKAKIERISVRELCLRKADSGVIGISLTHLLLFEMAIFGEFGYFNDSMETQRVLLNHLLNYFKDLGLEKDKLLFTICAGGIYLDKNIKPDFKSKEIINNLGIKDTNIVHTEGRRNFILSRGIDRSAGFNIEIFYPKQSEWVEIASMNIYEYLNKGDYLQDITNKGLGCGVGLNRINYILSDSLSIYETEPFFEIMENLLILFANNKKSIELVKSKLFRIIELSKVLLIILGDGHNLENVKSTYSKVMKSYLINIASELMYMNIEPFRFVELIVTPIQKYYNEYLTVSNKTIEYLILSINSVIRKNNK